MCFPLAIFYATASLALPLTALTRWFISSTTLLRILSAQMLAILLFR